LIGDDFINILGLFENFSATFNIDFNGVELYFFTNDLHLIKHIEKEIEYSSPFLKNAHAMYEIDLTFEKSNIFLLDSQITNIMQDDDGCNFLSIKIYYIVKICAELKDISQIKEEFLIGLIFETQTMFNKKLLGIKDEKILLLDSLLEEILLIKKIKDIDYESAKQYILDYHKLIFSDYSFEKFQNFTLSLDYLYDNYNDICL
jgi:hypothetical protein